jgi:hypothetical protein
LAGGGASERDAVTSRRARDARSPGRCGAEEGDIRILKGDRKKLMSTLAEQAFNEVCAREYAEAADGRMSLLLASVSEDEAEKAESIIDSFESGEGPVEETVTLKEETAARRSNGRRRRPSEGAGSAIV